jgi:hypothetical protein
MKAVLAMFGVVLVVITVMAVRNPHRTPAPPPASTQEVQVSVSSEDRRPPVPLKPATPSRLELGSTGTLSAMGGGMALLSITKDGYDEIQHAINAKDNVGLAEMVDQGRAFIGAGGSTVLVLENSFAMVKVRVQSGKNTGLAGWVPFEFVTR